MAKYTVEVRDLVEQGVNLFDFTYPIYQESHRVELQQKIVNHYYFREIGFETVGRFKHYLKTKLNEIMPTYNKLYQAYAQNIDVFTTEKTTLTDNETKTNTNIVDRDSAIHNTTDVDLDGTSHLETSIDEDITIHKTDSTTNKKLFSDTPQGRLNITDGSFVSNITEDTENLTEDKTQGTIANNTTDGTSTTDSLTTVDGTSTDNITTTDNGSLIKNGSVTGFSGITQIELLEIYRKKLIDIDNLIIADLSDLFMKVY